MRIAVVETQPFGGLLHYAVQLADALAERGHEVDLVLTHNNELSGRPGRARRLEVLVAPVTRPRQGDGRAGYLLRRATVASRLAATWARIAVESVRGRYDVVLLNCDIDLTPVALAALALTHLPRSIRPRLTYLGHSVRPYNRWEGPELYTTSKPLIGVLRRLYPRFDLVFVHGERSRDEFQSTWPPTPLALIPHGDEALFASTPPAPAEDERVLFFGDWRKVKGLEVLMLAFDRLVELRPEARLTIAGTPSPGDLDPDLVHRWAEGHGDRVRVIDRYVPLEEVEPLFAAARVVTTPYLVGYQSGVIHLAMTMGRAVVTSDVGDLPAAVGHGDAGVVVPAGEPEELAAALAALLSDRAEAERLGDAGRRRSQAQSSWSAVAEQMETALEKMKR